MSLDTARNLHVSGVLFLGGYIDHRKGTGAVLMVRNELVHLDRTACLQVAEYLQACVQAPPIPITPPTVIKAATKCPT